MTYTILCNEIESKNLKSAYSIVLPIAQKLASKKGTKIELTVDERKIMKLCDMISYSRICIIPKGFKRKTTKETIENLNQLFLMGCKF